MFCGYRIVVIMSAFQAEDGGSIPLARSEKNSSFMGCFCINECLNKDRLHSS